MVKKEMAIKKLSTKLKYFLFCTFIIPNLTILRPSILNLWFIIYFITSEIKLNSLWILEIFILFYKQLFKPGYATNNKKYELESEF